MLDERAEANLKCQPASRTAHASHVKMAEPSESQAMQLGLQCIAPCNIRDAVTMPCRVCHSGEAYR